MAIPWEVRVSLRQGTVFYARNRALTSSEPHYLVVVNRDPLAQNVLLVVVTTSQIEKAKKRVGIKGLSPDSVVSISKEEYSNFSKDSCVDCNTVISMSLDEFCEKMKAKEVRSHDDLPPEILTKLVEAIRLSPLVAEEDKEKI